MHTHTHTHASLHHARHGGCVCVRVPSPPSLPKVAENTSKKAQREEAKATAVATSAARKCTKAKLALEASFPGSPRGRKGLREETKDGRSGNNAEWADALSLGGDDATGAGGDDGEFDSLEDGSVEFDHAGGYHAGGYHAEVVPRSAEERAADKAARSQRRLERQRLRRGREALFAASSCEALRAHADAASEAVAENERRLGVIDAAASRVVEWTRHALRHGQLQIQLQIQQQIQQQEQ